MRSAPATESAGVIAGCIGRPSPDALLVPAYVLTDDNELFQIPRMVILFPDATGEMLAVELVTMEAAIVEEAERDPPVTLDSSEEEKSVCAIDGVLSDTVGLAASEFSTVEEARGELRVGSTDVDLESVEETA